jgi:hypothetical protein
MVVRHYPAFGNPRIHVLTARTGGEDVRMLGDAEDPGQASQYRTGQPGGVIYSVPEQDFIQWSPDAKVIAIAGHKAVSVFRADGTGQCRIPLSRSARAIGFARGSAFLVASEERRHGTLDFFDTDCRPAGSVPAPSVFDGATAGPDGAYFAFLLPPSAWITDERGGEPREVTLEWPGKPALFLRGLTLGRYTEEGRGLCVSSEDRTRCYDTDSAQATGVMPGKEILRMVDASSKGARIVFVIQSATALETAAGIAAVMVGNGGVPPGRSLGCSVWDYRSGKEILRWNDDALAQSGVMEVTVGKGPARPAFALSAAGDQLAIAKGSTVRIYQLAPD